MGDHIRGTTHKHAHMACRRTFCGKELCTVIMRVDSKTSYARIRPSWTKRYTHMQGREEHHNRALCKRCGNSDTMRNGKGLDYENRDDDATVHSSLPQTHGFDIQRFGEIFLWLLSSSRFEFDGVNIYLQFFCISSVFFSKRL